MKKPKLSVAQPTPTLRADGRYMLMVRIAPGPKGRKPVYGSNPEACIKQAEAILSISRPAANTDATFRPGTFGRFYNDVVRPTLEPNLSPGTRRKYDSIARVHLLPSFGALPMDKVQHEHILKYRQSLGDLSEKQQRHILAHLRQSFRLAYRLRRILLDPTEFVDLPDAPRKRSRPEFEEGFAEALLSAAEGTWMEGPVFCALRLGLRRGEIAGLQWNALDRKNSAVIIQTQLLETGETTAPKGGKIREIPVTPDILDTIERIGKRTTRGKPSNQRSTFVFTFDSGLPLSPIMITKAMPELCRKAGVGVRWFHDLRAHFITELKRHTDPWTVAHIAGHSNPDTSSIYIDERRELKRQALSKVSVDTRGRQQPLTTDRKHS